ncbi:MAG: hypothetical protein AAF195_00630, partial [Pseudomonadota bacterium]
MFSLNNNPTLNNIILQLAQNAKVANNQSQIYDLPKNILTKDNILNGEIKDVINISNKFSNGQNIYLLSTKYGNLTISSQLNLQPGHKLSFLINNNQASNNQALTLTTIDNVAVTNFLNDKNAINKSVNNLVNNSVNNSEQSNINNNINNPIKNNIEQIVNFNINNSEKTALAKNDNITSPNSPSNLLNNTAKIDLTFTNIIGKNFTFAFLNKNIGNIIEYISTNNIQLNTQINAQGNIQNNPQNYITQNLQSSTNSQNIPHNITNNIANNLTSLDAKILQIILPNQINIDNDSLNTANFNISNSAPNNNLNLNNISTTSNMLLATIITNHNGSSILSSNVGNLFNQDLNLPLNTIVKLESLNFFNNNFLIQEQLLSDNTPKLNIFNQLA